MDDPHEGGRPIADTIAQLRATLKRRLKNLEAKRVAHERELGRLHDERERIARMLDRLPRSFAN